MPRIKGTKPESLSRFLDLNNALDLAKYVAREFYKRYRFDIKDDLQDYIQEAYLAVLQLSPDLYYINYLYRVILNHLEACKRTSHVIRLKRWLYILKNIDPERYNKIMKLKHMKHLRSNHLKSPSPTNDIIEHVNEIVSSLPPESQELLNKRYNQNQTLEQIGSDYGVTREAIRQREKAIFNKIKEKLECWK